MVQMLWDELDPDEDGIFRKREFLALSNKLCDESIENLRRNLEEIRKNRE